jgi:GT2 family glycosyltransferase
VAPSSFPLSVVILTFNRKEEIARQLQRLFAQTRINDVEVIVVDNHSTDGTDEFLNGLEGKISHIRLPQNLGAVARAKGMEVARGELVLTLDDDVYLLRADELERIIEFFSSHPAIDAVNFKVVDEARHALMPIHWFHPRPHERWGNETFKTDYISEGAVAFRRSALEKAGYYPQDFFISHEGIDLAFRLINANLSLWYTGSIAVVHRYSLQGRPTWRNAYYNTRNYLWVIFKYEPFFRLPFVLVYRLATTLLFCLRSGLVRWWLKAVWDGFVGLPRQWAFRQPLSPSARKRLREIRRFKPGFAYKVKNFATRTREMDQRQHSTRR